MKNIFGSVGLLFKSLCYNIKGKQKQNKLKEKKMEEPVHKSSSNEIAPNVFQMKKEIPKFSMFNFAKYCMHLPNPEQFIWKTLLNKSKTDESRWQKFNSPEIICDKMVNIYKPKFSANDNILVLFNLELIKALALNYENLIYSNIYFIADSEEDFYWVKKNFNLINIIKLEVFNINCLIEKIGEFNVRKFDVVFSNPPYNNGTDLKILVNIKNSFKEAIIVHPATWLTDVKNETYMKQFKDIFYNNFVECINFRGSKIFNIGFMSSLSITYINNEKTNPTVKINDKIINEIYNADNINKVTIYGKKAYEFNMFDLIEKFSKSKSILDNIFECDGSFESISKLKYPIKFALCRGGNPHFNDGYFDESLGYYVLNKDNTFFSVIAKGDKKKYHYDCDWSIPNNIKLLWNFNSESERDNFYDYAKSKVFRWIFSWCKNNVNIYSGRPLRYVPWLDFTQHWDDKRLCEEFNIYEDFWNYINNLIPDYYDDYVSGF